MLNDTNEINIKYKVEQTVQTDIEGRKKKWNIKYRLHATVKKSLPRQTWQTRYKLENIES
jgi:hypothetical protein